MKNPVRALQAVFVVFVLGIICLLLSGATAPPPLLRNFVTTNNLTTIAFTDAGADVLWGWDDTDNQAESITIGANLTYNHATHTLSGGAGGSGVHVASTIAGVLSSNAGPTLVTITNFPVMGVTGSNGLIATTGAVNIVTISPNAALQLLSTNNGINLTNLNGTNIIGNLTNNTTGQAGTVADISTNIAFNTRQFTTNGNLVSARNPMEILALSQSNTMSLQIDLVPAIRGFNGSNSGMSSLMFGSQFSYIAPTVQNSFVFGGSTNYGGVGGETNTSLSDNSVVLGGARNSVLTGALGGTIVGGSNNVVQGPNSWNAVMLGGEQSTLTGSTNSTIIGGFQSDITSGQETAIIASRVSLNSGVITAAIIASGASTNNGASGFIASGNHAAIHSGGAIIASETAEIMPGCAPALIAATGFALIGTNSPNATIIGVNSPGFPDAALIGIGTNCTGAAIVGGGTGNRIGIYPGINPTTPADTNGAFAFMGGGFLNSVNGQYSSIIAGRNQQVQKGGMLSGIFVGTNNVIGTNALSTAIVGGSLNSTSNSVANSVIVGGRRNRIGDGSSNNIILGGYSNLVAGAYSIAGGREAQATNDGTVVLTDSQVGPFSSQTTNVMLLRFENGVGINTNNPQSTLHVGGATTHDGSVTNHDLQASMFMATDTGKKEVSTLDGGSLTNVQATTLTLGLTNYINGLVGGLGQNFYFSGVTNSVSGSSVSNCTTMIDAPLAAATTNSFAVTGANQYYNSRMSTNTISRLEGGPVDVQTFIWVTGGGGVQSITAHPELYVWFTNDTILQIASAAPQTFTEGTGPTVFNISMSIANSTNLPFGTHLLLRWKSDAVANSPTINYAIGGDFDSHISLNVSRPSSTYVGSFIGDGTSLTNVQTTNIVVNWKYIGSTNYTANVSGLHLATDGTNNLITLPNCTNSPVGMAIPIHVTSTTANCIATNANGVQTIGGALSFAIGSECSATFFNDGSNWHP